MSRYRVLLLLLALTLAGALRNGRPIWWGITGAILSLLAIAVLWAWIGVNRVALTRRATMKVALAGQVFEEELKLTNQSLIPELWVEVRDLSTLPGHYASRVLGQVGGARWRGWRARTRCAQRGRFRLGPVEIRSGDPLGIYQKQRRINEVSTLLVYPAIFPLRGFALPAAQISGGDAISRRTQQLTANAAGVRDYVTGDSFNRIHWPTTARRGRLMSREFELDPASDVWIAIDLSSAARARPNEPATPDPADERFQLPPRTEEYAISIGASILGFFHQQHRAIGLIAHGAHRHVLGAERGDRQYIHMMETLAVVNADGALPFGKVLAQESISLPRGVTVIAISSSSDPEWVAAVHALAYSGLRAAAVFVDPASFDAGAPPSDAVLAGLEQAGLTHRVVRRG